MSAAGALGVVGFLAEEMAIALAAAYGGIRSPRLALAELGVTAPSEVTDATALVDAYEAARAAALGLGPLSDAQADAIAADDAGAITGTTAALVVGLTDAIAMVGALGPALAAAANAATGLTAAQRAELIALADELAARLVERALVKYLDDARPWVAQVLYATGVLEVVAAEAGPAGSLAIAHTRVRLRRDRLLRLVTDPLALMRDVHRWGEPDFDGVTLLRAVAHVWERVLHRPAQLLLPPGGPAGLELFTLALHVDENATPPGILASVRVEVDVDEVRNEPADEGWTTGLVARAALPIDLDVAIRPLLAVQVETPAVNPEVTLAVTATRAETQPPFLLAGSARGSRIELHGGEASITGAASWTGGPGAIALDPRIAGALRGMRLIIAAGDGFLAELTGGRGFDARVDVAASWTPAEGLRFGGSATLVIDLPVHAGGGRARIDGARIAIGVGTEAIRADVSVTASASIGPIDVTVGGVGLSGELSFPEGGGNSGPLHLVGGPRAPDRIGLGVHAGPVAGGGFLGLDAVAGRYVGALALDAVGVALSAVGVLETTGVGYSLAAVISGELAPIPIGFGFTLMGVGGLIGIHRRVDVDALRAALLGPGVGELFFAADPIAKAARLTSDLGRYFPRAHGRHVIGPAAKIGWGTPTLIEGEIAVLLEVPSPVRLVLLGNVRATLPTQQKPIIALNVDFVGDVDFTKKTAAIDATLRDSKVAGFPITGDLALRMSWGSPPSFVLSVGGFHSQFRPPPNFPALRRVRIPIGADEDPRLDIQGFLALTSNTAQVGAQVELYTSAGPLNIKGALGFEALLTFSPFQFRVDLWAGVALRRGNSVLASVHLDGTLTGPTPWRIVGEACLSLWFVDLCVDVNATFGVSELVELPTREIWPPLRDALQNVESWATALPAGVARAVTTAPPIGEAALARIDPAAAITVRQKVAPLNRRITRFAETVPDGADTFQITQVKLGSAVAAFEPVSEWFAPAQFEQLADADRLSRPGFEKMVGGVTVASTTVTAGAPQVATLTYETILIQGPARTRVADFRPSQAAQLASTALGGAALAPLRPPPAPPPRVILEEETYVIVSSLDLAPRLDLLPASSRGTAELALDAFLAANPSARGTLQVVPGFEVLP